MPDINGRVTQDDVDAAYFAWRRVAQAAYLGGNEATWALWRAFCRLDDQLVAQSRDLCKVTAYRL
jgi:hypothetical protein